jgi:hypothetical protein
MKYIVTEQQLTNTVKRLNKEKAHRGKLSDVIEELVLSHFKRPVCDLVAIFLPDYNEYIVIVLAPDGYSNEFSLQIASSVENFLGTNPQIIITQAQDCEKMEK